MPGYNIQRLIVRGLNVQGHNIPCIVPVPNAHKNTGVTRVKKVIAEADESPRSSVQRTEQLPAAKRLEKKKLCKNKYVRTLNQLYLSPTKARMFCRFYSEIYEKKKTIRAVMIGL